MNKKICINLIIASLLLVGCSTKQIPVETHTRDARLDFICKINDLKLIPNRPFTSPYTFRYLSYAPGRDSDNYYSCCIICNYKEQVSIFDINKPTKSSFNAEYSNGPIVPLYSSKSGASDGEKLIFQRGYNNGTLLPGGVPQETGYEYTYANTSLRYDLDFDYTSFEMINEYVSLCKSEEKIQNETFEDETTKYLFDIYPENQMISCFAISKETHFDTIRTNLYFTGKDDLFIGAITCDLTHSNHFSFQTITFETCRDDNLTSVDDFVINPNATPYDSRAESDTFFNQDINAYVSMKELLTQLHPPF